MAQNMSRKKGSLGKRSLAIKDAIEKSFNRVNGENGEWLDKLAETDKALYVQLIVKCVPSAVAVSTSVEISLGNMMELAQANLDKLKVVEHQPSLHVESVEDECRG